MCATHTPPRGDGCSEPRQAGALTNAQLGRLVDAHCHPTIDQTLEIGIKATGALQVGKLVSTPSKQILNCLLGAGKLLIFEWLEQVAQSDGLLEQDQVATLYEAFPAKVIPCYGTQSSFKSSVAVMV